MIVWTPPTESLCGPGESHVHHPCGVDSSSTPELERRKANQREERQTSQIFADVLSRERLGCLWSVPLSVLLSSSHIGPISVQYELSLVCSGEGHLSLPIIA